MAIMTPKFKVSYPKLFKPVINKLSGKAEFSVVAIFEVGANLDNLKKAAHEALVEKFGSDYATKYKDKIKSPFKKQDDQEKEGEDGKKFMPKPFQKGGIYMTLKARTMPGIVDEKVQPIIDEGLFYPGCWARATVNADAYDFNGNKGVSFWLNNVQKVGDDVRLDGKKDASEEFSAIDLGAPKVDGKTTANVGSIFD